MLIGSKAQLKSIDFILTYDDTSLELVKNAKHLGMFVNCDISWDFHVRRLWKTTYYHIFYYEHCIVYFQGVANPLVVTVTRDVESCI